MNISWKWLSQLVDLTNISPQELALKFTLAGFEIENIIEKSNIDTILDINISPNRFNAMNLVSMARETSAIFKRPLLKINNQKHINIKYEKIVNNHNYLYGYLSNIHIKPSPQWLQYKLNCHGIKSQNNLIDIIHLIQLKWGHNFEVFIVDQINNNYQSLQRKHKTNLKEFVKIDKHTTNIKIQTYIKDRHIMPKTSCFLANKKNSYDDKDKQKQEVFDILNAYSEAILLIQYLCQGKVHNTIYETSPRNIYQPFILNANYINNILGFSDKSASISTKDKQRISKIEIVENLNYLNFQTYTECIDWIIEIPPYRSKDLIREIDIIEEIGRIYGFDKLIDNIPTYITKGTKSKEHLKINQVRSILRNLGLTESIHYSLTKVPTNYLEIYNPLIEDYKNLRDNIISNILEANHNNIKQGNEPIETFEIGRIFHESNNVCSENIHVAGLLGGKECYRLEWSKKPKALTWFQAKGDLEELFERLQVEVTWKKPSDNYFLFNKVKHLFHTNRVASIYMGQKAIGILGQLDLKISKKLNMPEYTYGFEIELKYLVRTTNKHSYYFKNYSRYPYMTRDITISTTKLIEVENIISQLNNHVNELIESVSVFDYYTNKKNNSQTYNISLRLKYRSQSNTLTGEVVDSINQKVETLIKQFV